MHWVVRRCDRFYRMKAKRSHVRHCTDFFSMILRPKSMRAILNHKQMVFSGNLMNRVKITRLARQMYRNNCLCPSRYFSSDILWINIIRTRDEGPWFYQLLDLGFNYRITDLQCALGCTQMKKLEYFLGKRRRLAKRYDEAFRDHPWIEIPYQLPEHNF